MKVLQRILQNIKVLQKVLQTLFALIIAKY